MFCPSRISFNKALNILPTGKLRMEILILFRECCSPFAGDYNKARIFRKGCVAPDHILKHVVRQAVWSEENISARAPYNTSAASISTGSADNDKVDCSRPTGDHPQGENLFQIN